MSSCLFIFFGGLNIYQSVILSYSKNGRNRYYRFIAGFKGVQEGGGIPYAENFTLSDNVKHYGEI